MTTKKIAVLCAIVFSVSFFTGMTMTFEPIVQENAPVAELPMSDVPIV